MRAHTERGERPCRRHRCVAISTGQPSPTPASFFSPVSTPERSCSPSYATQGRSCDHRNVQHDRFAVERELSRSGIRQRARCRAVKVDQGMPDDEQTPADGTNQRLKTGRRGRGEKQVPRERVIDSVAVDEGKEEEGSCRPSGENLSPSSDQRSRGRIRLGSSPLFIRPMLSRPARPRRPAALVRSAYPAPAQPAHESPRPPISTPGGGTIVGHGSCIERL